MWFLESLGFLIQVFYYFLFRSFIIQAFYCFLFIPVILSERSESKDLLLTVFYSSN
jgi:hypothetical protein